MPSSPILIYYPDAKAPCFFLYGSLWRAPKRELLRKLKRLGKQTSAPVIDEVGGLINVSGLRLPFGKTLQLLSGESALDSELPETIRAWAGAARIVASGKSSDAAAESVAAHMPPEACAVPSDKGPTALIQHFFQAAELAIAEMKRDGRWSAAGRRSAEWNKEIRTRRLAAGKKVKPKRGKITARAYVTGAAATESPLSLESLTTVSWQLELDGHPISVDEIKELLNSKHRHTASRVVEWHGERLVIDKLNLRMAAKMAERQRVISRAEALRAVLSGERISLGYAGIYGQVYPQGVLQTVIERMRSIVSDGGGGGGDTKLLLGDFRTTLRPYQERGVQWLTLMNELGLGACLADDMGLGKTVQVLAFLLNNANKNPGKTKPSLIVCPTTVIGNWEREIARFAPSIRVVRHYGADRARTAIDLTQMSAYNMRSSSTVVLTTYALLRKDIDVLRGVQWDTVVLDEAQNIKSSASAVTKAARILKARIRFALTGTPVENRLTDLWSILEFTTPGLLGPLATFKRTYSAAVEKYRDEAQAQRLRGLISPFVLRRLKTDSSIVPDLPPKQESEVVCTLTREQAALYRATVDSAMRDIGTADGMQRRGEVLSLITKLKQICNHPAHYLRDSSTLTGRSGKLTRLGEMLEEAVAEGDKALVFTQYKEMGEMIVSFLSDKFGSDAVQFLHGGTPARKRDEMVERFQNGGGDAGASGSSVPIFVLSLKAGGTGLNLTAANHVFHYDRWWNPAVEDQATDRAFRIGQSKPVNVYKMIAAGTLEESIGDIISGKRELAGRVVPESGGGVERWVTELEDEELRRVVGLGGTVERLVGV